MERADLEQWKAREVARLLGLVETERRYYQEIAASIPVGVLVLSSDLTIISANRALRRMFGLSGSTLRARLDALLPAWVLDRVAEVLKSGAAQTNIMVAEARTGRRLRIGIIGIQSWDEESAPEALVSIEDLSGPGNVPAVPSAGNELTADITERRMLQDLLVQAERSHALSNLSGRLAHDLNNILMIVTGHSEELLNGLPANSPLRADVEEIINATERMSGLTGHLLAFTRRQSTTAVNVSLNEVLGVVGPKISLPLKHSSPQMVVKSDAQQLEQMLTSLMQHQHQVQLEASRLEIKEDLRGAIETLRPGSYAVIRITLPERPFDPAAKSSALEAILPGKDGDEWPLALTRAYGIVRQWGGDIVLSAASSRGTEVQVLLQSADDPGNREAAPAAKPAMAEPGLKTILVVDDESAIRELVLKILRRNGYQALEAANGEEALALCRAHSGVIDLLITDVMMPRMGGPELVDRLRKQGINPKVLYVSGYTGDANLSAGNAPPGTAFVEKPFTLQALLAKVQEVLSSGF